MESLTWNKTDTDAVYAYMQEQERPAYMDTVRSVTAENGVPYLRFPMLESESFIEHGFSTRKGGVSTGIYESMNLTFNLEDDPENVSENFRRMAAALHTVPEKMVYSKQTHTTNVLKIEEHHKGMGIVRERDFDNIDGLVTMCRESVWLLRMPTVFLFFLRTAAINVSDCPIRAGEERWEISHR